MGSHTSSSVDLSPFLEGGYCYARQSSGAVRTGSSAWVLIPYPILPPSLINHKVSVDVKHRERRRYSNSPELRSCVNREVGLGSHSLSQISK